MLSKITKAFISVLFIFYPIVVFFSLRHFSVTAASAVLCLILVLRLVLSYISKDQPKNQLGQAVDLVCALALLVNGMNLIFKNEMLLKLYPFFMSFGATFVFVKSLLQGPPLIEDIARRFEGKLNAAQIRYTRKLTQIWSFWLAINTTLALYTALALPSDVWVVYNNILFYLISGFLFAGDFAYRKLILRAHS